MMAHHVEAAARHLAQMWWVDGECSEAAAIWAMRVP